MNFVLFKGTSAINLRITGEPGLFPISLDGLDQVIALVELDDS